MTERTKIRRHLLRLAIMAGALALLPFLLIGLVIWQPNWFLPHVVALLSLSGNTISTGKVHIGLSPPLVQAETVVIHTASGTDIRMARLVAEADALAWWQGQAWLNLVEVEGLRLSMTGRSKSAAKPPDFGVLAYLPSTRVIRIKNAAARLALGDHLIDAGGDLAITPAVGNHRDMVVSGSFQLRTGDAEALLVGQLQGQGRIDPAGGMACRIDLRDVQSNLPWLQGPLSVASTIMLGPTALAVSRLELVVPPGTLRPFGADPFPMGLNVIAAAQIGLSDATWQLVVENLSVGDLLQASATLAGQGREVTAGGLSGVMAETGHVAAAIKNLLPGVPEDLTIGGKVCFRAALQDRDMHKSWTITLAPEKFRVETSGLKIDIAGTPEIVGPLAGPWSLGGRLQLEGAYKRGVYDIGSFSIKAPLAGDPANPRISGWELDVGANRVLANGRPLPLGVVTARGDMAIHDGQLTLDQVTIRSAAVGAASGSVLVSRDGIRAALTGPGLDMAGLSSVVAGLAGLPARQWQAGGRVNLQVDVNPQDTGPQVSVQAALIDVGFQNPEATIMGQNISGTVLIESGLGSGTPVKLGIEVRQGEALWDTVYLPFKPNPLTMSVRGVPVPEGGLRDVQFKGALGKMGDVMVHGAVWKVGPDWNWRGQVEVTQADLQPIFDTFVRQPMAVSTPQMATMRVAGQAGVKLNIAGRTAGTAVSGDLRIEKMILSQGEHPPLLENLNLFLPFSYGFGRSAKTEPAPDKAGQKGHLEIQRARLGQVDIGPLKLPIRLAANRLNVDEKIRVPLAGTTVSVSGLYVDEPLSPAFVARFDLGIERLDLSQLPLGPVTLEGHLESRTLAVTATANLFKAQGSLQGQAFDGRLGIDNIAVRHPMRPGRQLSLDLNAENVNLAKLSPALRFGSITGLVNINLKGLSVAHHLPVGFHLFLQSVPQAKENRMVSLQAVNSISLVGTGADLTGLGVSLFKGFFEYLPYREIGIECILRNDVFTVRGLIHEDGVEYLIKRPALMGVNVVNGNPDNRIGFSEMISRIRRAGATPGK